MTTELKETYTLDEVRKIVRFAINTAMILQFVDTDVKQLREKIDDIINIRMDD